jgi:hypothetical protein
MHSPVDLYEEALEIRVEPSSATRTIEPKRLPARGWQSGQARETTEVDLAERVRATFDITEYCCEQMVMSCATRCEQFRTQTLRGCEPLLDRSAHHCARFSWRWHPGRGIDNCALDPDGR